MIFRWYGENDPIKLEYIRQIPCISGIASAVYKPVGEVWEISEIERLKKKITASGLEFEVIESVPVHEDIKLRKGRYKEYTENYKQNIINLAKCGIKCICYNFMPVFDWTRTQIDKLNEDGSYCLCYRDDEIEKVNPENISLPGWDSSYKREELNGLVREYNRLGEEGLWESLECFLNSIIPIAKEYDVNMAIHPDDPPWNIFGIPRIITNEKNIDRFLKLYDDVHNGLTLCSGSLGCGKFNDYVRMVKKYNKRIHFAHIRNIKVLDNGFDETAHFSQCGSLDMVEIMKAYHDFGFEGYIRPDHGRMIWGEKGKAGYGLYDRALGASYLAGIWETLEKKG